MDFIITRENRQRLKLSETSFDKILELYNEDAMREMKSIGCSIQLNYSIDEFLEILKSHDFIQNETLA